MLSKNKRHLWTFVDTKKRLAHETLGLSPQHHKPSEKAAVNWGQKGSKKGSKRVESIGKYWKALWQTT
jgi:hypothetical protein